MVGPSNAAAMALSKAFQRGDITSARAAAGPAAVALRTFADQVAATAWPAKVQPTANQLLIEVAEEVTVFNQIAAAKTDAAAIAAINAYNPTGSSGQTMRILLGLPDAPVV